MTAPKPGPTVNHVRLAQALRAGDLISLDGFRVKLTRDAERLRNNDAQVMLSGMIVNTSAVMTYTVPSDRKYRVEHPS